MRPLPSIAFILAFAALMALSAQVTVPMTPVPMTLQTLAVLLAGAVLGAWRGTAAAVLYLGLAALGLPLLSEGSGGLSPFTGATAGYLFAFPIAAGLVGVVVDRDRLRHPAARVALMLVAHLLILGLGTGWLATRIGWAQAQEAGFLPFLIGALVKSIAVVAIASGLERLAPFRRA
ncbi:biotin transporter BioY [Brevundimonas sp.]|uniref:biotin transporter BioY n=1 Tax=Brevundimonas sp. TaxID=1871086 RepID=UPI002ABAF356|nr:biotin transporter BioY [Brevundimonas sp.]MDZ4362916.1 biotin transporter BioY [Brevundimonas sp.]